MTTQHVKSIVLRTLISRSEEFRDLVPTLVPLGLQK